MRAGSYGSSDLWMANRSSVNNPWSKPINLDYGINSEVGEYWPALSADGQILYFSRGIGSKDVHLARRDGDGWTAPQPLPIESWWTPDTGLDGRAMLVRKYHEVSTR